MNILYVLVEDIKNDLKLFNNNHIFEPNISEKSFFILSQWWLNSQVLEHCPWQVPEVNQSVAIQIPSIKDGEGFLRNTRFQNMSVVE